MGGLLVACAGPEFKAKSTEDTQGGGGGGGGGGSGGSGGKSAVDDNTAGASGDAGTTETPCGIARYSPSTYDVELCVPAGTFTMGRNNDTLVIGEQGDHSPAHEVTLSPFLIDAYEVTVGRYRACVKAGSCNLPGVNTAELCTYTTEAGSTENRPVSCVSAGQASTFCRWDNNRRLPTEAEWERVAAGMESATYPWRNAFDCSRAVIGALGSCKTQYSQPLPVGSLARGLSAEGAYDMAGNVAEWVKDIFAPYPIEPQTDPEGPTTGSTRIIRGGGYKSPVTDGQTFVRVPTAGSTIGAIGFRCARSAEN